MINKWKLCSIGICISILLGGCGEQAKQPVIPIEPVNPSEEEQEERSDEYACYWELIDEVKKVLTGSTTSISDDAFSCVIWMNANKNNENLGYMLKDIDDNGIDELIFGESDDQTDSAWNGAIYDIYTISDGDMIHVLDGWDRNRYYLSENGLIVNEGSSSAAISSSSYYSLENSQLSLVEAVIYDGTVDQENPWFYSTKTKEYTEDAVAITSEQAEEYMANYVYLQLSFTSFINN